MARQVLVSSVAMAFAWAAMLMAHGGPPQETPRDATEIRDLTLSGCVVESTETGVYILDNAVARPEIEHVPRTFRLVSAGDGFDFTLHANHQVQATGRAEIHTPPPPPPGGRIDPRDLPALTVQSIQSVADRCLS